MRPGICSPTWLPRLPTARIVSMGSASCGATVSMCTAGSTTTLWINSRGTTPNRRSCSAALCASSECASCRGSSFLGNVTTAQSRRTVFGTVTAQTNRSDPAAYRYPPVSTGPLTRGHCLRRRTITRIPAPASGRIPRLIAQRTGQLGPQRTLQHRLGQTNSIGRPHRRSGVHAFTASLINESSASAENVSTTWRVAGFSLPRRC